MRLIDADALIAWIEERICKECKDMKRDYGGARCRACQFREEIDDMADKCESCKWYEPDVCVCVNADSVHCADFWIDGCGKKMEQLAGGLASDGDVQKN